MERPAILIVEVEPALRRWVAERAERLGQAPVFADGRDAALAALAERLPHVLVVDGVSAAEGAPSLLELAPARAPGVTSLVISADRSVGAGVEAMKRGALDFLVHPLREEAFDAALVRALSAARARRAIAALASRPEGDELDGTSPAVCALREHVDALARGDATVLLEGESGTGKKRVARMIHARSSRSKRPFLEINCAALPGTLFDAELFGHEKGAFTGAQQRRAGLLESARGGTVLLDEIGRLRLAEQAKLLRLIEDRTFRRVGGCDELRADVRIVVSSDVDLERRALEGGFRGELFHRLNVIRLRLPPLRERREDVPLLAAAFVAALNARVGRAVAGIAPAALVALAQHDWPGNVRELRNVVERALVLYPWITELRPEHLPPSVQGRAPPAPPADAAAPVDVPGRGG